MRPIQHADDQGDDAANKADRLQTRWHLINRGIPARFFDRALRRAVRQPLRLQDAPREADGLGLLQRRALRLHARHNVPLAVSACPRGALWDAVPRHGFIDSDISGISLSGGELRGAKVNLEQAAMLGQLLAELPLKSKSSLNTE